MKTFTKLFTLLFAFTIMGMNLNAQHFTDPNGDPGSPLLEIWIYGATVNGTHLSDGDEIAAYDGDKLVGKMVIDIAAPATTIDETNWISNKLVVYSKDASGNNLYQPGHPIILRAWDGSVDTWWAHTWNEETSGNPNDGDIQFHNDWYAPIGDTSGFANIGAFFPADGENGYCYVDLDFTATDLTNNISINFDVFESDHTTRVNGVLIESAGYSATTTNNGHSNSNDGEATIDVYHASGTINYTFTISKTGYDTEILTIPVDGSAVTDQVILLDAYGKYSGTVYCYNPSTTIYDSLAHGAVVQAIIGDSIYSDWTDINGDFLVEEIPDGECTFTVTYPGYQSWDSTVTILNGITSVSALDRIDLPLKTGTLQGEVFNAQTLQLMASAPVSIKLDGTEVISTTDGNGAYTFTKTAGTYDLEVSLTGYHSILIEDFVLAPDVTTTENFNLLDENEGRKFEEVTGNPNKLWSIHIESAKFGSSSLLPFDELAIYKDNGNVLYTDDELVGSIRLNKSSVYQNSGYNVIKAFGQDNTGTTLFTGGESFYFKAYDVSHGNGDTTELPISWNFNQYMGTYHGNVFPDPDENHVSYLNIYWDYPSGTIIGTVTDDVTPPANLENVTIEVFNIFTGEVVTTGTTDVNGQFTIGVDQGTYNVKFSKDTYATKTISDIVVNFGEVYDLGVISLADRDNRLVTYYLGTENKPGFYFIGSCLEQVDQDILTILDNSVGSFTPFSKGYFTSWIENESAIRLVNVDQTSGAEIWIPQPYNWYLKEGYQVYRSAWYRFEMSGFVVEPEDNPIEINSPEWNYVPYFPYDYDTPDDAITAFASILDSIDWVMDQYGNRLHKDNGNWIDNIGQLDPRQGYKIKAHHSATLVYPAEASKDSKSNRVMLDPVHYIYNGGNAADWTYTMYINTDDFDIGDEIAAYSNGVMVGSMVIDSDLAWENDLNTFFAAVESGYEISSDIELMAWDVSEGNDYYVEFEMVPEVADAYIGTKYPAGLDHFSYVNVYRGTVRVDENQINNDIRVYPNPTSNMINIESVSNINTINIYNIHGALIDVLTVNSKTQSVNVENFASGTYLIQMNTDTGVITKRILVK